MEIKIEELPSLAKDKRKENQRYFQKLRKKKPKNLDVVVSGIHDEVFEEVDCLKCANCCKTTSPLFLDKDIDRIAKHLGMKPSDFVEQYLHIDEDGDYVLNVAPCPFLGPDNYCHIYEARPKACREYPHTNRKRFVQILNLTLKNTEICPAAYKVVEQLKEALPLH